MGNLLTGLLAIIGALTTIKTILTAPHSARELWWKLRDYKCFGSWSTFREFWNEPEQSDK